MSTTLDASFARFAADDNWVVDGGGYSREKHACIFGPHRKSTEGSQIMASTTRTCDVISGQSGMCSREWRYTAHFKTLEDDILVTKLPTGLGDAAAPSPRCAFRLFPSGGRLFVDFRISNACVIIPFAHTDGANTI